MTEKNKDHRLDSKEVESRGHSDSAEREKRDPFTFKSGAVYEGEWRGSKKDGFGVQIWPDGAKYEGYWLNNRANGMGKFFHADGDLFEGEWIND